MTKKNKLYTVNKWNRPAFMPEENTFKNGGWAGLAQTDKAANPWNYADDLDTTQQYMQSKNAFGLSKADNPFSKGNLQGGLKSMANTPIGGAVINGLAGTVGGIAGNAISHGYDSGAGSAVSSIGGTIGSAVGAVNPVLGAAIGVGSQIVGGLTNRAFGTKVDEKKLAQANADISSLNSFTSNAGSFDGIVGPKATGSVAGTYKGGWFNSSASKKQKDLEDRLIAARQFADRSIDNNVYNIADDQINDMLYNYSAFGGPLGENDMGAIEYGFMSDYLTNKKNQTEAKNKVNGISPMPVLSSGFALGGVLQNNGGEYSVGKIYDVSETEAKRLKAMGYEYEVIN